jgi:hypothetical protein
MTSLVTHMLVFAAENADVGGRGDNPDEGTGIVTILIAAGLILAVGLLLAFFFTRSRPRRRALEPHADRAGHAGRVGAMRRD